MRVGYRDTLVGIVMVGLTITGTGCGSHDPAEQPTSSTGSDTPAGMLFNGLAFTAAEITVDSSPRPVPGGTLRIDFSQPGSVSASAGCNIMNGSASVDGDTLIVESLATTEMGCDTERHEFDQLVAELLTGAPAFVLDASSLTLTTDRIAAMLAAPAPGRGPASIEDAD